MENKHIDPVHGIEEMEFKANELINLMFEVCEMQLAMVRSRPDARVSALTFTVMAVQNAIQAFLSLARIC